MLLSKNRQQKSHRKRPERRKMLPSQVLLLL
jgi:hypothetical protein